MDRTRELRAKLLELHGAVKGYFEATLVGVGGGYFAAFDALRRNPHMAESFVGDLQALLDHLEREIIPALAAQAQTQRAQVVTAPAAKAPASSTINDDRTMLLARLPANVQAEALRFAASQAKQPTQAPAAAARSALAARPQAAPVLQDEDPSIEMDDGDVSLLQEGGTDPDLAAPTPLPAARPAPVPTPRAHPGPSPARPAAPAPIRNIPPARPAAPTPTRSAGSLAARIAAVTQPPPGRLPPAAPGKPAAPAGRGTADPPPSANPAARPTAGERPRPAAKQSGRHSIGPAPQFDESDLTDPGFTLDKDGLPGKKR